MLDRLMSVFSYKSDPALFVLKKLLERSYNTKVSKGCEHHCPKKRIYDRFNKYIKKCSNSSVTREIKIKTNESYCFLTI